MCGRFFGDSTITCYEKSHDIIFFSRCNLLVQRKHFYWQPIEGRIKMFLPGYIYELPPLASTKLFQENRISWQRSIPHLCGARSTNFCPIRTIIG